MVWLKTTEQKAREYKHLKRIEAEKAKQRKQKGRPKKDEELPVNLPDDIEGDARDLAAAAVGMSGKVPFIHGLPVVWTVGR